MKNNKLIKLISKYFAYVGGGEFVSDSEARLGHIPDRYYISIIFSHGTISAYGEEWLDVHPGISYREIGVLSHEVEEIMGKKDFILLAQLLSRSGYIY